jgi:glycosyltransferase involved in cell wall biosynthesis
LGVSHYLLGIAEELASFYDLVFYTKDIDDIRKSESYEAISRYAFEVTNSLGSIDPESDFELLPHHFTTPMLPERSLLICHDLHVFDVPWKYTNVESLQMEFRRNLSQTAAVVCHFPRTYYLVERYLGSTLKGLFYTESPLLLDTSNIHTSNSFLSQKNGIKTILYPAQVQAHKNHRVLIDAAGELSKKRNDFRLLFPGTSFSHDITTDLQNLVKAKGLTSVVIFLGRLSDQKLLECYSTCYGVIIPSLAEGGAYIALESVAAGRPVAVNNIESARMHLQAYSADVHWFDANNPGDVIAAMESLLSDDSGIHVSKNAFARQKIKESTWNSVAKKYTRIFEWMDGGAKPRVNVSSNYGDISYE